MTSFDPMGDAAERASSARITSPSTAPAWHSLSIALGDLTTDEVGSLLGAGASVVLVPVGSTEPHGPHLALATDAILAEETCKRAVHALRDLGRPTVMAPVVPYGVTRYARGFHGCIGVSEATLAALLGDVARALLDDGFSHVAFVNHHLEPAHAATIAAVVETIAGERGPQSISFPSQLGKRWGRTLTDEFKRGQCHAGSYETSLVLAAREDAVRTDVASKLPPLTISLSKEIAAHGDVTFSQIGMARAYTGAPAEGNVIEGHATYEKLVAMVVTEVQEHLGLEDENTARGERPSLAALREGADS